MKLKEVKDISKLVDKILDGIELAAKTSKRLLEGDPAVFDDPQVKELIAPYITEEKYDRWKDAYKKGMEIYNSPHEVK